MGWRGKIGGFEGGGGILSEISGLDEVDGGVEGRARPQADLGWS